MASAWVVAAKANDVNKALGAPASDSLDGLDVRTGLAPLHLCVENDSYDVAKLLLERKANVDVRANHPDRSQWTPLHFAYDHNRQDMVQLLLRFGADEEAKAFTDDVPRDRLEAFKHRQEQQKKSREARKLNMRRVIQLVMMMDTMNCERQPHAVHYSKAMRLTASGNTRKLEKYLLKEATKRTKSLAAEAIELKQLSAFGRDSNAGKVIVIERKKRAALRKAEDHHIFNISDYDSRTGLSCIHIAAKASVDMCKLLVRAKADVTQRCHGKSYGGWTPLHFAFRMKADAVVEYLIKSKADPDALNDDGDKPAALIEVFEKEQQQRADNLKLHLESKASKESKKREREAERLHSVVCDAVKARSTKNLERIVTARHKPNLDECEVSTGLAALHYAAGKAEELLLVLRLGWWRWWWWWWWWSRWRRRRRQWWW
jgi:ankyrin repeat protein